MAELNEAWRTLGDPPRRAVYDADLRRGSAAARPGAAPTAPERPEPQPDPPAPMPDRRLPWRGLLFFGSGAVLVVLVASLFAGPSDEKPPDNVLGPGSCVTIEPNGDAREVRCGDPHDGTVARVVPFDATCPFATEAHRDRQGMGVACVTMLGG